MGSAKGVQPPYAHELKPNAYTCYSTRMEDEAWVRCPYCHERQLLVVDPGTEGAFVQDCDVCCRPWQVAVSRDDQGELCVEVERAQ